MPVSQTVEKILSSLIDDFKSIVCTIKESKDLQILLVEELVGSLEAHKQRRRKKKELLDQALQAQLDLNGTRNTQGRGLGGRRQGGRERGGCGQGDVEADTNQTKL